MLLATAPDHGSTLYFSDSYSIHEQAPTLWHTTPLTRGRAAYGVLHTKTAPLSDVRSPISDPSQNYACGGV